MSHIKLKININIVGFSAKSVQIVSWKSSLMIVKMNFGAED
jgi:hypothetical protein